MKTNRIMGAAVAFLGAAAMGAVLDTSAWAAPLDNPSAVVLVLMDRSGSMHNQGMCHRASPNQTFVDRKWVCGVVDATDWVTNTDVLGDRAYFFWQFGTLVFPDVTDRQGPFSKADVLTKLAAFQLNGPFVDDSGTPLAAAYCDAVDFLVNLRDTQLDPSTPLYIKLESDGLENASPVDHKCHGDDSGADHPFTRPALPLHDVLKDGAGNFTQVDGVTVPTWQSNMLDMGITSAVHNPAGATAFKGGAGGTKSVITEVTFLSEFISPSIAAFRFDPAASADPPGPDSVGAGARAFSLLAAAASATPSAPGDFLSFLSGLAEATGGRLVQLGSGQPTDPNDPTSTHEILGDADDSGCVDQADFDLVKRVFGKPVDAANLDTFHADLNLDGVINAGDYAVLKGAWGTGCATPPVGSVPVLGPVLLGFEDASQWTGRYHPVQLAGTSNPRSEGEFALRIDGTGWREITSVPFKTTLLSGVTSKVAFDIFIPKQQSNIWWHGEAHMNVNCPSAQIFNEHLGAVQLTNLPTGQFVRVTFPVSAAVKRAMTTAHSDFSIIIAVNANDPGYGLDNLRFVP